MGSFSDGSGTLYYRNDMNCKWMIAPTGATQITLSFSDFDTESCCDFVRVWQCGNTDCSSSRRLLATLSGSSRTRVVSQTGFMLVQLITDASVTGSGFAATWTNGTSIELVGCLSLLPVSACITIQLCSLDLRYASVSSTSI